MTRTAGRILWQTLSEDADVYHFHDPELIPVGLCLKLLGRRVVYDVHEDVPRHILSKAWIHPRLRPGVAKAVASLEKLGERCFDGIVAATPGIARRFCADNSVVVQNYPILEEFSQVTATRPYHERAPLFAYIGGMTTPRGIQEMVQATGLTHEKPQADGDGRLHNLASSPALRGTSVSKPERVFPKLLELPKRSHALALVQAMALLPEVLAAKLHLAGAFMEAGLEARCRALPGWQRVVYLGWQSRAEVAALLRQARAGLVTLHPLPNYTDAYPVKLFEYMAAGLPVVAADFPLWRQIIDGAGCGLLVDPRAPQTIARALEWLLTHPDAAAAMGGRGRQAVVANYNWDAEAKKLLAFYGRLLA